MNDKIQQLFNENKKLVEEVSDLSLTHGPASIALKEELKKRKMQEIKTEIENLRLAEGLNNVSKKLIGIDQKKDDHTLERELE